MHPIETVVWIFSFSRVNKTNSLLARVREEQRPLRFEETQIHPVVSVGRKHSVVEINLICFARMDRE